MLKNLTLTELEDWCESLGEPRRRATQVYRWIYAGTKKYIRHLDEADGHTHSFSNAFKSKVASAASLSGGITLQSVAEAKDGTRKLVFALNSGEGSASGGASVETVLIPMQRTKEGEVMRYTACLSTQVGCAMNCQFCFTGRMGLLGNLSTAQIIEQVVEARRLLISEGVLAPIGNIVFMGMGEPLHNYDALLAAIDILAQGLQLSRNKIIVSTVGLATQMRAFLATGKAKLALSLHATTDEVRDWIVPTNRRHPISELMSLLKEHFPQSEARGDRFVVIEYVLLRDVNDTKEDALRLAELLKDVYCMINLIVFNPHEGTQFKQSAIESVLAFRATLVKSGKICTIRHSKGDDTMAACGQLGDPGSSPRPAPMLQPPENFRKATAAAGGDAAGSAVEEGVGSCSCSKA